MSTKITESDVETVWLTQKRISELFSVDVRTISEHLQNIFSSNELVKTATVRNFQTVQKEVSHDLTRKLDFYNLDAIAAVDYQDTQRVHHQRFCHG